MANQEFTTGGLGRRQFLKLAGYGTLGAMAGGTWPFIDLSAASQLEAADRKSQFLPDLDLSLIARPAQVPIFPGEPTQVWQYQAIVHKGSQDRVVSLPRSYLGPIIKAHRGEKVRIRFRNDTPEKSIVHWHGLHVPAIMDGHPRHVVSQGESYFYEFEVKNRAGTYWYHPHPHGRTGPQVYAGLAGLFLIHDEEEEALELPRGEFDLPFVLQDRIFTARNQFDYPNHRMTQMEGLLGDQILLNGNPELTYAFKAGTYRLRLLNGSNARIYKLAWKNGNPLTIIGTDGGLLETPREQDAVTLAPAQRIDLWVDLSKDEMGTVRELISLPHSAPGGRETFSVLTITVNEPSSQSLALPEQLATIQWENPDRADNRNHPRTFELAMGRGMQFEINGRTFAMEQVANDEKVKLGDLEIWEFENVPGGMGMMNHMDIPHPMHIHGLQFQILERDVAGVDQSRWGNLIDSCLDAGWHDTVLVHPGEKIRLLMRFTDFSGLYLYHCHNLEHEDMGMMRNYLVES